MGHSSGVSHSVVFEVENLLQPCADQSNGVRHSCRFEAWERRIHVPLKAVQVYPVSGQSHQIRRR